MPDLILLNQAKPIMVPCKWPTKSSWVAHEILRVKTGMVVD